MVSLIDLIQDITKSDGHRYNCFDNNNNRMDTAKIIQNPTTSNPSYIAVYHTGSTINVATSSDLLNWTHKKGLGSGSQPTIIACSDNSFVVGWEFKNSGGASVRLEHYADINKLLSGISDRSKVTSRSLSNSYEGTPSIYSVTLSPDIDHSVIDVGHHYYKNANPHADRQARGTLTNFTDWSTHVETDINNAIESQIHQDRNIGDRDGIYWEGTLYTIHEADGGPGNANFAGWRLFLYNHSTKIATKLSMTSHGGSTAYANPTITKVKAPDGSNAIVVGIFMPKEGAATGENDQLIYYKKYSGTTDGLAKIELPKELSVTLTDDLIIAPVCKDSTNKIITCPEFSYTNTDKTVANVRGCYEDVCDPKGFLVQPLKDGTIYVTAKSPTITSNKCKVIVGTGGNGGNGGGIDINTILIIVIVLLIGYYVWTKKLI